MAPIRIAIYANTGAEALGRSILVAESKIRVSGTVGAVLVLVLIQDGRWKLNTIDWSQ